ncbi:YrzQ family protein [Neobacillus sp. FSL H8-0543]
MNKVMTSVIALGVGVAAYNIAQRNNMMSGRQMKKMQRKVKRALF